MQTYKLLTPGPLTTTDTVKKEMLFDHCTWDDDYKKITLSIRRSLLNLAHVDRTGIHGGSDAGQRHLWGGICTYQRDRRKDETASDCSQWSLWRADGSRLQNTQALRYIYVP